MGERSECESDSLSVGALLRCVSIRARALGTVRTATFPVRSVRFVWVERWRILGVSKPPPLAEKGGGNPATFPVGIRAS